MKAAAVVLFGGTGSRLGSDCPKQFLLVRGQTVMEWTLKALADSQLYNEFILVSSEAHMEETSTIATRILHNYKVVPGGKERANSVLCGLQAVCDSQIVAIHDGARPNISIALQKRLMEAILKDNAQQGVIPGIPQTDTLKIIEGNRVVGTQARQNLVRVQTPQFFLLQGILNAYESGLKRSFMGTDCSSYAEEYGLEVQWIEGESSNFKVTYEEDLSTLKQALDQAGRQ